MSESAPMPPERLPAESHRTPARPMVTGLGVVLGTERTDTGDLVLVVSLWPGQVVRAILVGPGTTPEGAAAVAATVGKPRT